MRLPRTTSGPCSPTSTSKERTTRERQLKWWAKQFSGLALAEITAERISQARDALAAETFTRGSPHKHPKTGEIIPPEEYKRTGATVNRYIAALSHALSFAVKERRLLDRNPVSDIRRKSESRGRTRFLTDDERMALLDACGKSEWAPLRTLVLLAITTGARRGELIRLKWADVDLKKGRAVLRETKNDEPRMLPLAGRALEACGIQDFRFHDLRHTTASMLAAQGASLLEIADVLGHKTLAMVKRYSHLVVDHRAMVIEKMVVAKGL